MSESEKEAPQIKPKCIVVDRKFKAKDLKIRRNKIYMQDLLQCFKILQKWGHDIIWVETGVDAMKALKEYPDQIDCVVVEAYVPGGGFTVARLIRFKPDCKHIPVFLMSEQLTQPDLDEGKRIGIFDCLVRPFRDLAFLEDRLKKGIEIHGQNREEDVDTRAHILSELENITGLPAMPTVYNEIEKLSKDPGSTTEQYSRVIEMDPAITTQMLRLCNSSAFSFSRKISSVGDAVNLLGLQTVVDFVRTLSVVGAFKGSASGFDTQAFWRHSIASGVTAKLLLQRQEVSGKLNIGEEDPFMAGMVHDIGKQVLGYFFNEMCTMVFNEMQSGRTMHEVEQEILGITHADIGAALADKWQLPGSMIEVIGNHHSPTAEDRNDMVYLIHLADSCSKQVGFAFSEKKREASPNERVLEQLELDAEAVTTMFGEMESTIRTQVTDAFSAIFA